MIMKKVISIFLALLLTLALCSCGHSEDPSPSPEPSPAPSPAPEPDPSPAGNGGRTAEELLDDLYNRFKGVWVRQEQDPEVLSFLAIGKADGKVTYTAGIPGSESVFGGEVSSVTADGSSYKARVHVTDSGPEGGDPYDISVSFEFNSADPYWMKASDHAASGENAEFIYFCEDLETADWDALDAGSEPIPGLDHVLASELWEKIRGIWLIDQDYESSFFTSFTSDEDRFYVSQGIPASGYMLGGTVTDITVQDGVYELTIYIAAVEESEMDSGHDAVTTVARLEISDGGKLRFTCFAGAGDECMWRYAAADWDSFDWSLIYGVDADQAWSMLNGAWVGKNDNGQTLFAHFYTNGPGENCVDLGIPFTGPDSGGKITAFEDRITDRTWWPRVELFDTSSGILIMIDYSSISDGKITMTDYFDSGKPFTLEYKAPDPQSLTEEMVS